MCTRDMPTLQECIEYDRLGRRRVKAAIRLMFKLNEQRKAILFNPSMAH